MQSNQTLDRRGLLKKATAVGTVGVAAASAGMGAASDSPSHGIRVSGGGTAGSRYVIKNAHGSFEGATGVDSNDWAGDRIVGYVSGGSDSYLHDGTIKYVNVANGLDSSDPKLAFGFPVGSNNVTVTARGGANWEYRIRSTKDIWKGSGSEDHEQDHGRAVSGRVYGGHSDSFYYTGTIDFIEVSGPDVSVSVSLHR